jgi:hypothetical protein
MNQGPTDRPTVPERDQLEESLGQALGRYKLLEKVDEDGFGVVYVAEQRSIRPANSISAMK